MPIAFTVLVPMIVGLVFVASGLLKIQHPDDPAAWEQLGVPRLLQRPALVRAHPWVEVVLGVVLITLGGWVGLLAALGAVGLMAAYTELIVRALRRPEPSSCACFGAASAVTRGTLVRNLWLLLLAVLAVVVALPAVAPGPLVSLFGAGGDAVAWTVMAVAAALTVWLVVRDGASPAASEARAAEAPAGAVVEDEEMLDYLRARTPAVPVTLADGSTATLRDLSASRAVLLFAVSEACGSCVPVIDRIPAWREQFPELDVRVLLANEPGISALTSSEEPQSLHDPQQYVRHSLGYWATPSAVLLGADGMLAGGPVTGEQAITEFVEDIEEQLHAGLDAEPQPVVP